MANGDMRIGILGCGAIGRGLASAVDDGIVGNAALVALFDERPGAAKELAQRLKSRPRACSSFQEFMDTDGMALVIEAASQEAARQRAEAIVAGGKHLMMMSTGALMDADLFSNLGTLAREKGCRVLAPSGAIGGIDAIRASRDGLEEVVLTTHKPPETLVDTAISVQDASVAITSPRVVFEGNAIEAVRRFPFNVNVAATLSLAGIGPERTKVRIVADPEAKGNTHEVYARGKAGVMRFTMENVPHPDNPRTSYLALLSAIVSSAGNGGTRRLGMSSIRKPTPPESSPGSKLVCFENIGWKEAANSGWRGTLRNGNLSQGRSPCQK